MTKTEYQQLVKELHMEWEHELISDEVFLKCLSALKNELPKTPKTKTTLKRFFR